jgi:hypothetical protein
MTDSGNGLWHKSSYSNGSGGNCVEVAAATDEIRVRDSKNPEGDALVFSATAWAAFIAEVRAGVL